MTKELQAISDGLEAAMKKLQTNMRSELKAQGHYNTGKLHDSIEYTIEIKGDKVTATMESEDYGLSMEFGVKAANIPYSRGSGAPRSKYIEGLISFFESKGLGESEAKGAAFATANKHKQEGLPTRASFAFSTNGRRTGFASTTLEKDIEEVARTIEEVTGMRIELNLTPKVNMEHLTIYT